MAGGPQARGRLEPSGAGSGRACRPAPTTTTPAPTRPAIWTHWRSTFFTVLPLWTPPELARVPSPDTDTETDFQAGIEPDPQEIPDLEPSGPAPLSPDPEPTDAVEIDRIVPASGNLGVCGQQFWLGTHRAGHTVTLRIDTITVHLAIDGTHLKTLPSRMTTRTPTWPTSSLTAH